MEHSTSSRQPMTLLMGHSYSLTHHGPRLQIYHTAQPEFPISMTLTEFHLVILYSDRIAAISLLDESLVHEELLPLVST